METKSIQQIVNNHIPFTGMLYELVKSLLESQDIKYHIVESRTKEVESLIEKVRRKNIQNFQNEIHDISGIRIILYYQADLDKVEKLINDNFNIDFENSINKENIYESNEFGYLSRHYIIQLNTARKRLPEWKRFSTLKAEIQVRTVLQHSWASISHELSYKKNYEIPKELSRKLFRLAGLFELADEQFLEIKTEHETLKNEIDKMSSKALSNEEINQLTLENNLLRNESIFNEIKMIALESGFIDSPYNKTSNSIASIIIASRLLGLNTIGEIENTLSKSRNNLKILFQELISNSTTRWEGDVSFFSLLGVLFNLNENQLKTFSKKTNWNNDIWKETEEIILKTKTTK